MTGENERKVFGIGFHKTGTSTLGQAFKILGYRTCSYRSCLVDSLEKKNWQPIFNIVKRYDAFEDNPWPLLYQKLDQVYPNSKFILTRRNEDAWIRSASKHFRKRPSKMRKWIYKRNKFIGNEAIFLERYRTHNREVLEYFQDRPDDLLVIDWAKGDGWKELCQFLGKDIPGIKLPHINKGSYHNPKNIRVHEVIDAMNTYYGSITNHFHKAVDSFLMHY